MQSNKVFHQVRHGPAKAKCGKYEESLLSIWHVRKEERTTIVDSALRLSIQLYIPTHHDVVVKYPSLPCIDAGRFKLLLSLWN